MMRLSKLANRLMWMLFFSLGCYILIVAGQKFWPEDALSILKNGRVELQNQLLREAASYLYPGLFLEYEEEMDTETLKEWYIHKVMKFHPLYRLQYAAVHNSGLESMATYEMLLLGGVQEESETIEEEQQEMQILAEKENQKAMEQQEELPLEEIPKAEEIKPSGNVYSLEQLSDFDFLLRHFYTVENNTSITPADLNVEALLSKDMKINKESEGPQILIYHTHSQEGFVDSIPGDNNTTIVGVGAYLAQLLRAKGYDVMHLTSVYDLVDGKLDRNEAYSKAEKEVSAILQEYPSIQSVIDLHRDGVQEGTHLIQEINGKTCAKFMFFNGLSRTKLNGAIDYLYNPYIQDNLALTLQLKLLCEQYYPGLARNIYLKSLRYNLHLSKKALLIEAGAQTNTLQEMLNAMEPLAEVLDKTFSN